MKRLASPLALGACTAALLALAVWGNSGAIAQKAPTATGLEVHEWGTFTSMQGVDGLALEGLHHEEEALPSFVHNLGNTEAQTSQGKGGVDARRVTQKMETPVIYFYPRRAMRATVDVSYPGGLISEWFPAANHRVRYRGEDPADGSVDLNEVRRSSIRWDVDLTPARGPVPRGIPAVAADDPWSFARQTRAAFVASRGSREADHYLFYRGLGAHKLPVSVTTDQRGALVVDNKLGARIPFAAVLEVGPKGARFASLGAINRRGTAALGEVPWCPLDVEVVKLKALLTKKLVATGLFADEARAMVRTWSRQWFTTEGTRLIYIVPRETTDALLPISITPRPDRLVRTLVGRVEVITPSALAEIERAVLDSTGSPRLARLGRFLEPHLRHIQRRGKSQEVRAKAAKLLAELVAKDAPNASATTRAKTRAKRAPR